MQSTIHITGAAHQFIFNRLLLLGADFMADIDLMGASICAEVLAETLKPGFYRVNFPEFGLSTRMVVSAADKMQKLIEAGTHSFEVKTSSPIMATRIKFDKLTYQPYNGEPEEIQPLFGKDLGDVMVRGYTL